MKSKHFDNLGKIIAKYYKEPIIQNIPPQKEIVTKKIEVEEPYTKTVEEDTGPKTTAFFIPVVIFFLVVFALNGDANVAVGAFIGAVVLAFFLSRVLRNTQLVEKKYTKKVQKEIREEIVIKQGETKKIYSNEKINKIYIGALQISAVPFQDKTILINSDSVHRGKTIKYPCLKDYNNVYEIDKRMDELSEEVPYILEGEKEFYKIHTKTNFGDEVVLRGFEKELIDNIIMMDRTCQNKYYVDLQFTSFNARNLANYLEKKSEDLLEMGKEEMLHSYLYSEEGMKLDEKLQEWIKKWKGNTDVLETIRDKSLKEQISNINFEMNNAVNFSAFNFYCPECNKEKAHDFIHRDYSLKNDQINDPFYLSETTLCNYDQEKGVWVCRRCNNEFRKPIPVPKVLDEILLPTYIRLMDENQNERLKVHKEIKEKELDYNNKMETEIEKISFENISSIDHLNDDMGRMNYEVKGEMKAVESLDQIVTHYKKMNSEIISDILNYCGDISHKLEENTESVNQQIQEVKKRQTNFIGKEFEKISLATKKEEETRDRVLKEIIVNLFKQIDDSVEIAQGLNSITEELLTSDKKSKPLAILPAFAKVNNKDLEA